MRQFIILRNISNRILKVGIGDRSGEIRSVNGILDLVFFSLLQSGYL